MTVLKIKKLHPDAIVPQYQTAGAACFDLHALYAEHFPQHIANEVGFGPMNADFERVHLPKNTTRTFRTGLAVEVPEGYALMIYSRSGHGFKNAVRLANCVGVIDSDYRGELMVKLTADAHGLLVVRNGDRIAQAMLVPVEQVTFELVDELTDTARGSGGFGSTGDA